jgi:hypothetical protein
MMISPKYDFLFKSPGAKRFVSRVTKDTESAILPLTYDDAPSNGYDPERFLYARDANALRLTENLADRLTREFPRDVRDDGFAGPSAVPGDFYALRNVSGLGMDPLPLPSVNNAKLVDKLGLAKDIHPADVGYLKEIIRLFFGAVTPESLHIRKEATTSFPYFTTDIQYKKLGTLKCLHNIDDFLKAMSGNSSELKRGLDVYHSIHLYAIYQRQQPNKIIKNGENDFTSKPRPALSEEDARNGNLTDTSFADMTAFDRNGKAIPGHFAMRRRTVWGMSGLLNYTMTAVMGCVRKVYLKRFAFTYKTRGPADKEERISRYRYVVGSDVANMDTTIASWFFDFFYSELTNYWDESLVAVLKRMMHASYVAAPPWKETHDDYNPLFGPDPLGANDGINPGLPSGIFINPDIGKLWMTFVYVILFRDAGAIRDPSDIESFLQGKNNDHAMLDMGDDATLMTNSTAVAAHLKEAKSPYAVLEPETPVIFLGDVFAMEGGKKRAFPNPLTYIVNALAREQGIQRTEPSLYSEGVLARYQQYASTPIFRDLNRIYEEEVRSCTGTNPYLIARAVARRQKFDATDALVIANPNYLHYRVDPEDVSPEVLDSIVATIPAADFFNQIRHLFKVPTVELEEFD